MEEYEKMFRELSGMGVSGVALIGRDGMIQYSELPVGVHEETFGIMMATIVGAAKTANMELSMGSPKKIVIDSPDGVIVTSAAGKKNIITIVVGPGHALEPIFEYLDDYLSSITE